MMKIKKEWEQDFRMMKAIGMETPVDRGDFAY